MIWTTIRLYEQPIYSDVTVHHDIDTFELMILTRLGFLHSEPNVTASVVLSDFDEIDNLFVSSSTICQSLQSTQPLVIPR